jgi:hypothetical protein
LPKENTVEGSLVIGSWSPTALWCRQKWLN